MAVAFDWGLTVQLLIQPLLSLQFGLPASVKQTNLSPLSASLIMFVVSLPAAALIAVFGEGIRRGWRWTRPIQIVANALGFLGGFFSLYQLWQNSKHGNYWSLVAAVILLVFSPLIAWRLSRPATAQWFANVSSAEARKRHGGFWILGILGFALVGGILQAMAGVAK